MCAGGRKIIFFCYFYAKKNCQSQHETQNPRKTPLICPRIASNPFDVHLTTEAKTCALRRLKNEPLKFFEFYLLRETAMKLYVKQGSRKHKLPGKILTKF